MMPSARWGACVFGAWLSLLLAGSSARAGQPHPVADHPSQADEGAAVSFSASRSWDETPDGRLTYEWDFGDGSARSQGVAVSHVYQRTGAFTVTLTAVDQNNLTGQSSGPIAIRNVLPTPVVYAAATELQTGQAVYLSGEGSRDAAGIVTGFEWDLDYDGRAFTVDRGGVLVTDWQYASVGERLVGLRVTDDENSKAIGTLSLFVYGAGPLPRVVAPATVEEGGQATLSAAGSDPGGAGPLTYEWDFAYDGSTFRQSGYTGAEVVYVWQSTGTFRAAVRVRDVQNRTAIRSTQIVVTNRPPVAELVVLTPPRIGVPAVFDASGSRADPGSIVAYEWCVDYDGIRFNPVAGQNQPRFEREFTDLGGSHVVAVRVKDDDLSTDIAQVTVTVGDPGPQAVLTGPDRLNEGQFGRYSAELSSGGGEGIARYEWDLEYDGATFHPSGYEGVEVEHGWSRSGSYRIAVRVSQPDGDSDVASLAVTVVDGPPVAVITGATTVDEGGVIRLSGAESSAGSDQIIMFRWDTDYNGSMFYPEEQFDYLPEIELPAVDDRVFQVALKVIDSDRLEAVASVTVTVSNVAPVITSQPSTAAVQDRLWDYRPAVTDPGGVSDPLSFQLEQAPDGMRVDGAYLYWTPGNAAVFRQNRVVLVVRDGDGGETRQEFEITVQNVNDPPRILGITNNVAVAGEEFTARIQAEDVDPNDGITFELVDGPAGMLIDPLSGALVWTPDVDLLGEVEIAVGVEDQYHAAVEERFSLLVLDPADAPRADAGPDRQVDPGLVSLSGAGADPQGRPLTYLWRFISGPETISLRGADTREVSFVARTRGQYLLTLTAFNPETPGPSDEVAIEVANEPPAADACCDRMVEAGRPFALDGSRSIDVNHDPLTFEWRSDDLSIAEPNRMELPLMVEQPGLYLVRLSVIDDLRAFSTPRSVWLQVVEPENGLYLPVARPGPAAQVPYGQQIVLDGSASYGYGQGPLSFHWLLETPAGDRLDYEGAVVSTVPAFAYGLYTATLTVEQDGLEGVPASTYIQAGSDLGPMPRISAGRDQVAEQYLPVTLQATETTGMGGIEYRWEQISGPWVILDRETGQTSGFFPMDPGRVVLRLHGRAQSGVAALPVEVSIIVNQPGNALPLADAGADQELPEEMLGQPAILDGSASDDDDGDPLSYRWRQISGEPAYIEDPDLPVTRVRLLWPGVHRFELEVHDGVAPSIADRVTLLLAGGENRVPEADAGPDQQVAIGTLVSLDGGGSSDEDPGDQLSFLWEQDIARSDYEVDLRDTEAVVASFVAARQGTLRFQLTVSDGVNQSRPDEVVVIVTGNTRPVADAGRDLVAKVGASVFLDGSASSDADGHPLTFQWRQIAGDPVDLEYAETSRPYFVPSSTGEYAFGLIVSDGFELSDEDSVTVTAETGVIRDCIDRDNDGYGTGRDCLGPDCDDSDENRNAGIPFSCDQPDGDGGGGEGGGCGGGAGPAPAVLLLLLLALAIIGRRQGI